jgi:GTP 3',8-cyclase
VTDLIRIDSHKLEFHPTRVAQWQAGRLEWEKAREVAPLYMEVSPVGACNHRCTFCAVDYIGYKANYLDAYIAIDRLHEARSMGLKSVMFAGEGEPLLHKRINEINASVISSGLDTAFTTNGTLLDKIDLSATTWCKVSINAGTAETYARVHRTKAADFARVWRNIELARANIGKCTLGVQTVMLPEVAHEAVDLAKRCRDAGVDYLVVKPYSQHKFSITHEYEDADVSAWDDVDLSQYETESFKILYRPETLATKEITYDKCHATPFFWCYLMADGSLYSCSAYLLDERFRLGNINSETFEAIWHGERRKRNYEYVRDHLDIHECRVNCRMDKANRYLDAFFTQAHVNFI